jgi:hypothetical protein
MHGNVGGRIVFIFFVTYCTTLKGPFHIGEEWRTPFQMRGIAVMFFRRPVFAVGNMRQVVKAPNTDYVASKRTGRSVVRPFKSWSRYYGSSEKRWQITEAASESNAN